MKEKEMEELAERTASKLFEKIMKYIAIGFILYLVVMVGSFGIHEIKRINEERKAKEYEKWLNEPVYTIENDRKDWYWVFSERYKVSEVDINQIIPKCEACRGLLKPDFVFFGESIPSFAYEKSVEQANLADVFLIIGTTGMVIPAAYIPQQAKRNGVTIIEINKWTFF